MQLIKRQGLFADDVSLVHSFDDAVPNLSRMLSKCCTFSSQKAPKGEKACKKALVSLVPVACGRITLGSDGCVS